MQSTNTFFHENPNLKKLKNRFELRDKIFGYYFKLQTIFIVTVASLASRGKKIPSDRILIVGIQQISLASALLVFLYYDIKYGFCNVNASLSSENVSEHFLEKQHLIETSLLKFVNYDPEIDPVVRFFKDLPREFEVLRQDRNSYKIFIHELQNYIYQSIGFSTHKIRSDVYKLSKELFQSINRVLILPLIIILAIAAAAIAFSKIKRKMIYVCSFLFIQILSYSTVRFLAKRNSELFKVIDYNRECCFFLYEQCLKKIVYIGGKLESMIVYENNLDAHGYASVRPSDTEYRRLLLQLLGEYLDFRSAIVNKIEGMELFDIQKGRVKRLVSATIFNGYRHYEVVIAITLCSFQLLGNSPINQEEIQYIFSVIVTTELMIGAFDFLVGGLVGELRPACLSRINIAHIPVFFSSVITFLLYVKTSHLSYGPLIATFSLAMTYLSSKYFIHFFNKKIDDEYDRFFNEGVVTSPHPSSSSLAQARSFLFGQPSRQRNYQEREESHELRSETTLPGQVPV